MHASMQVAEACACVPSSHGHHADRTNRRSWDSTLPPDLGASLVESVRIYVLQINEYATENCVEFWQHKIEFEFMCTIYIPPQSINSRELVATRGCELE